MDTVTHSLLGALVARASAPSSRTSPHLDLRERSIAGALAAAFPDIDYLTFWIDPLTFLAEWHRGPTHSIVLLPIWALSLGLVFAVLGRRRSHWRELVAVCALALASHVASDVITAYGTQVFSPISDFRISLGTTFVIDAWFSAIIVLGLLASQRWSPRRSARYAGFALLIYVAAQGLLQHRAIGIARDRAHSQELTGATASALPQPFSPFNWKLILSHQDSFHVASINLFSPEPFAALGRSDLALARLAAAYRPVDRSSWTVYSRLGQGSALQAQARQVWCHDEFRQFRRFARYPVLYRVDSDGEKSCVWFTDLRYVLPVLTPPFRYGMCRQGADGAWALYRLRRFTADDRQALPPRGTSRRPNELRHAGPVGFACRTGETLSSVRDSARRQMRAREDKRMLGQSW